MKRSFTLFVAVGYLLLVPYCFFGASVLAPAHAFGAAGHSSGATLVNGHAMSAEECIGCGSVPSAPSASADHAGMYLSVTSVAGTPLLSLLLSLVTLLFAAVFVFSYQAVAPALVPVFSDARKERRRLRATSQHDILRWLSLSETSPTFA